VNAGLLAVAVLALGDKKLAQKWRAWRASQTASIATKPKKSGAKK
jgi:5-(carboxyamino)imidazole ribonucleotide mutase